MNKWKAGQCVTINRKRYRVTKCKGLGKKFKCCIYCAFKNLEPCYHPCYKCAVEESLMQSNCYLRRIWTKRDFK
jgi:hypothetical protein